MNEPRTQTNLELVLDVGKVVLPVGKELLMFARQEVAAGRAQVIMNREDSLKAIDEVVSESWEELPVVGGKPKSGEGK